MGATIQGFDTKDSKYRILEEDFNKMLEKVNWDMCLQKMSFTGHEREELSEQKQLDYTIYVKGKERLPSNVTAVLSLFSLPDPGKKSKKGKYNCKAHVGHVLRRATTILNSAGPSRSKIVVGVTNLRCVQWYTVEKPGSEDDANPRGPYLYARTPEIDATKRSLAAIFLADPAHLYCDLSKKHSVNDSTVEFVEFLGSGATSSVYKASHLGDSVAAKLYKKGFSAHNEMEILKLLEGVQGVPIFKGVAKDLKVLLLSPVGKRLKKSVPTEVRINLTGIIDTLKEAHHRHIVHRDVRMGNILLVDDRSFMLIDWGFASKVGEMAQFQGSLLTASSRVLEYHGHPIEYMPEDDLISFVKSLYLFSHERLSYQMRQFSGKSGSGCLTLEPTKINSLWKQLLEGAEAWQRALELAEKLSYDELKDWVSWWAVNFCPIKL